MRVRDRIYYGVLLGATVLHFAALGGAVAFHWWNTRRFLPRIVSLEDGLRAESQARADGIAAARADFSALPSPSTPVDDAPLPVPELLGFGQTKSTKRRMVYADYRMPDGSVHREYISSFPL